jgi:hypothetical protein
MMEWLVNLLPRVTTVYTLEHGSKRRVFLLSGTVIRYLDGRLNIGGQLVTRMEPASCKDMELWLDNGCSLRISNLDVDIMGEKTTWMINAESNTETRVLYSSNNEDSDIRTDIELSL